MKKILITSFVQLLLLFNVSAQNESNSTDRLKVFIDCSHTRCDMTFIRTEINIVDFMLDRIASDVHILITSQGTGSGGYKYQLIFFGQNRFKNMQDTLYFNTGPNQTGFEIRDVLVKYLKLGLAPLVAKTDAAKDVTINFKKAETDSKDTVVKAKKDPWNYWVYRGVNGNKRVILTLRPYSNIKFVQEAENGEELLNGLAASEPDVVLMDLRMPGKDGIETTKAVSK
jgi:CheY-like chemotaxis protein